MPKSVSDLVKDQDGCCGRCKRAFHNLAGKLEELLHLAMMNFSLIGGPAGSNITGKMVVICPACAREIEQGVSRG